MMTVMAQDLVMKIRKAATNPYQALNYSSRKSKERLRTAWIESYRRRKSITSQKELIHDFVTSDQFVIIVLDACRYD